ncbi:FAD-dependent monooxygenase [Microbacterium sp. NPDC058389]|uniref:FAD-dependent monooxygenase n=1 Tax=Microbacterium sp. NPDC058389 TaxID=3346475 RepID=UPI0036597741
MQKYRILIVGAGIAGAAAGALLGRSGHDVTLVERSAGVRSSGSPVDIRGEALGVVRDLGLEAAARERDTGARTLALVGRDGRPFTTIGMRGDPADIEIARVDLASVLAGAAAEVAEVRFDDTFADLAADAGGVGVRFASGRHARFDLVIGADGQNSATRRTLWGVDAAYRRAPRLAIATAPLSLEIEDPRVVTMYNEPGVSLTIHPAGGRPGVAFIFRTADAPADRAAQIALLRRRYASTGWRAAEFLAALDDVPDLYFDRVRRVAARSWAHGRVTLLGDAASSLTILGEGSSMAILGARTLDRALREAPDVPAALAAYEARHRPVVERAQSGAALGAAFLVPAGAVGLGIRDLVARALRRL